MNLTFKLGSSLENLNNVLKEEGTLYFLSGLNELYIDINDTTRLKVVDTDALILDIESSITLEI